MREGGGSKSQKRGRPIGKDGGGWVVSCFFKMEVVFEAKMSAAPRKEKQQGIRSSPRGSRKNSVLLTHLDFGHPRTTEE